MTNPPMRDVRSTNLRLSFFELPFTATRPCNKQVKLVPTRSVGVVRRRGFWAIRCVDNSGGC